MEDMERVYQEYAQTVYKFLCAQTWNADLAEELTQETFYQAVKSIDRFDGSCKMSVWLCQIAKHKWYQYLRRHKRELPLEQTGPDEALPSAEEQHEQKQNRMQLLQKIHELPEPAREVVYLRAFGGLSFREIGEVTGHTENWARVTFYRGKERLRGGVWTMKNKLPCPVVRDLLPSYLEGLTEPETGELVREHLAACSECAAHCKAMQGSDEIDSPPPQQQKEVDYLKKVRRSNRKKILLTAVLVALVLTAGIWTQLCWIGSPLKPEDYYYHAVEEMPGTLRVVVSMNGSAQTFAHKKVINEDGVVKITARKVLASPWNRAGYEEFYLPLDDVNEIWVMDQPIWKDGLVIE